MNSNTPDIPNYSTDNNPLNTPGPYIQDSLDTLGSILKPEEPNNENLYSVSVFTTIMSFIGIFVFIVLMLYMI